jgi:head-tail adaptor
MGRIGRLDRTVALHRPQKTRDEYGGTSIAWVADYPVVPARKRNQSGREALQGNQEVATNITVFTIRWLPIDTTYRVVYEGKEYDIKSLNEIGRRNLLEIIATTQDNQEGVA